MQYVNGWLLGQSPYKLKLVRKTRPCVCARELTRASSLGHGQQPCVVPQELGKLTIQPLRLMDTIFFS